MLSEPWVLLATFRAHVLGIPVACVQVQGGNYDFGDVKASLEGLDGALDEASKDEMVRLLGKFTPPATLGQLQSQLAALIPNIISVVYRPDGTQQGLEATVRDIADKQTMLVQTRRTSRREVAPKKKMRPAPVVVELEGLPKNVV